MTRWQRTTLFLLRLSLGWLFFYAGISKLFNPSWSAAGYLHGAKTFAGLYEWLAQPGLLPVVNLLNEWGALLLGVSLLLGVFVRISTALGAVLMLLYYVPILEFPYIGKNAFLVDEHIVYALALLVLGSLRDGRIWGLETWCSRLPICARYPRLRWWLG